MFAGTGLQQSEPIAAHTWPPLVGYECDGAPLEDIDPRTGLAVLSREAARCGTPPDFRLLAVAALGDGWQELPPRESQPDRGGIHAATMGIFSRNGTVFSAGTTDWAQVLSSGEDPRVQTITRNVIDRLLGFAR